MTQVSLGLSKEKNFGWLPKNRRADSVPGKEPLKGSRGLGWESSGRGRLLSCPEPQHSHNLNRTL